MREGMNQLLRTVDVTFRRDAETLRPRINREGSVLDREQRAQGEYLLRARRLTIGGQSRPHLARLLKEAGHLGHSVGRPLILDLDTLDTPTNFDKSADVTLGALRRRRRAVHVHGDGVFVDLSSSVGSPGFPNPDADRRHDKLWPPFPHRRPPSRATVVET